MRAFRLAIIGRPNVGKSTLFNYLTSSRKAVVRDEPGVTRDILIEPADLWGKDYEVMDTGGLTESSDLISRLIRTQVVEFLSSVDALVVVVDGRAGLCPEDSDVIRLARETNLPFLVVVNKLDKIHEMDVGLAEFYQFNADLAAASFEHRQGLDKVLEWIFAQINSVQKELRDGLTFTIVGKPNVGKSSLVNRLLGENRVLVSPIAGTTTDSVETNLEFDGRKFTLIDTAGLRRTSKREEDVEIISAFKTQESIRRSNIVLLVIDASQGPSEQDAKILQQILEIHRPTILVANKADLASQMEERTRAKFREEVARIFHFYPDIPVVFTSAKTGGGLNELLDQLLKMEKQMNIDISTRDLNDFFMDAIRQAPAPVHGTQNVKFYYITQTNQTPPAFIAFANFPESVDKSYRRFLAKKIKERFDLGGIPIRIFAMQSHKRKNVYTT